MKILHLYKSFYPETKGGVPYIIQNILSIPDTNVNNEVFVTSEKINDNKSSIHYAHSYGTIFSMPISPMYMIKALKLIRKFDILFAHTPFPYANIILLMAGNHKRKVIFWHADIIKNKLLKLLINPIINLSIKKADAIIIGHEKIIETNTYLEKNSQKCYILPFPVDVEKYKANQHEKEANLIIACGRLVRYKGFSCLIEAMKDVNAILHIIGDGPEKDKLENKIRKLNIQHKVKIISNLSDDEKINYFKKASIFVFSSITEQEAYGIVQLEAMASGCAIINTNIKTAVPLIARNNYESITIEPNNATQLKDAINLLLKDTDLRLKLANAGYKRVKENFSTQIFNTKFIEIINQINSKT
jgi:glycosyltransferase involved in cell wall biosynthesis